jgi:hypothetical protein
MQYSQMMIMSFLVMERTTRALVMARIRTWVTVRRIGTSVMVGRMRTLEMVGRMRWMKIGLDVLMVELNQQWLVVSYMVRKIGNSDPKFGMSLAKSVWVVLLQKVNANTAILKSAPSEVQEPVL